MEFLKNHPFEVDAFFKSSLVLTFAVPKEALGIFLPECLELDTFEDRWAFIAVALVETTGLKPRIFPRFFGNDFFLIGYRIFVRYRSNSGKRLRGLFILKSETDKRKMELLGNIFTHYQYTTTDIHQTATGSLRTMTSEKSKIKITIEQDHNEVSIPENSPFSSWKDARKFAGPLPFTFTYNDKSNTVLIIEGVRKDWKPKPVKIREYKIGFLATLNLKNIVLAHAFEIKDIPYYWKKGRIEKWIGPKAISGNN